MFSILRPYIFGLDPEAAHNLAIKSLKLNLIPKNFFKVKGEEILNLELFKIKMQNPIGLAAGFDKSAEVYNTLFKIGFGFIEVGTITPKPQLGNTKPRIFRLEKDSALINRLGFNNDGLEVISKRLTNNIPTGPLGINIGPNKDTQNKSKDFISCFLALHKHASYLTINISSPNTEGLRDFHQKDAMSSLLKQISKLKKEKKIKKPLLLKISPDIKDSEINNIVETIFKYNIDGIIISNTTNSNRENLKDEKKIEGGGLSGKPINEISTILIKKFFKETNKKIQIIGVGGIDSGKDAFEKIIAGANAVQLYTGMIYKGPGVVKEIKKDLIENLKKEKINCIGDAVGINA
jgi:dihydroorotate dehydrogenase|tara:strand:- start:820 stop:1866 length:1047 start_codon:yes stop_codon:yes gene_type:complete